MKKLVVLMLIVMLSMSALFTGCSTPAAPAPEKEAAPAKEEAAPAEQEKEEIKVGYCFQGLSDEYIVYLSEAVEAKAAEEGLDILVADGQMDAATQIGQIENFIAEGVDAIVMNPISMDGCAPAVDAAVEAGIPIINLISITSNQDKASSYVGSNSVESGEIEMQMAADAMDGKGNIVVMFGQMGHDAQIGRYQGLKNILEYYPDMQIIAEETGNWSREEGMALMENWISSGKEINGVVAQNDSMALGAVMAIEAAGLTGEIQVFGIDATQEALDAVEAGTMAGTVFQDAKGQGEKSVLVAIMAADGENIESEYYIPYLPVLAKDVPDYR